MADGREVKCRNCGFLACFHESQRRVDTLTQTERQTGDFPRHYGGAPPAPPVCFVAAACLADECKAAGDGNATLAVITKDRLCPEFMELRPGLSPEAHMTMKLAQDERDWRAEQERKDREYWEAQRKDDQDREERRRKEDRDDRERRDKEDAEWRLRQERENRRLSNRQLWIAGVLAALAVAAILAVTQFLCTWWQISDARSARQSPPPAPTPAPANP